ncbi:hypothetical protein CIK06_06355 [Plantactinospora sp. KBS50]|nr:hypothetical protein CIK06_06355 [Plantactinospora sp. KBS50]
MAVTLAAALAGCAEAEETDGQGASSAPAPSATTVGVDPSPSPSASATVTIPKSAFLDLPAELRKSPAQATDVAQALPQLCGNEFGSGGRSVTASAAMMRDYKLPTDPPENVPYGTIAQTVFAFEGSGAADYLQRVRGAVESCPSFDREDAKVTVTSKPMSGIGDEALLVTLTWPGTNLDGTPTGGKATSQVVTIRVADAATVLYDQGWEGASNKPDLIDDFARAAVRGLDGWQG